MSNYDSQDNDYKKDDVSETEVMPVPTPDDYIVTIQGRFLTKEDYENGVNDQVGKWYEKHS